MVLVEQFQQSCFFWRLNPLTTVQKLLNWWRCRLGGAESCGSKEPYFRTLGWRLDESLCNHYSRIQKPLMPASVFSMWCDMMWREVTSQQCCLLPYRYSLLRKCFGFRTWKKRFQPLLLPKQLLSLRLQLRWQPMLVTLRLMKLYQPMLTKLIIYWYVNCSSSCSITLINIRRTQSKQLQGGRDYGCENDVNSSSS